MRRELLVCLFLVLATLTVYLQVGNYEFVNFDDNKYISENPQVQAGFSRESIIWAFTTTHMAHWHPVTWLPHVLDFQLYGFNPTYENVSLFLARNLRPTFILQIDGYDIYYDSMSYSCQYVILSFLSDSALENIYGHTHLNT